MKAVIYLRQSLDTAGDELGVQRQEAECRRLADQRGYTIDRVITDNNKSASTGKRPGYEQLLKLIEARQVDIVIVLRLDRLLRRLTDLEHLITLVETTGVQIITVSGDLDLGNAQGRLVGRLVASVARAESEIKGERHVLANRQKAQAGKPHGSRRPFGYCDNQLDLYEPEAEVLRLMASLVLKGWSYKEIAWHVNEAGHRTTENKLFYPITIRNMLSKPRYGGKRVYEGVEYQGIWTPVFTPDEWERLQLTMRARQKPSDTPVARKYLLTGFVFCGRCDMPLNGSRKQDRPDAPIRRNYCCRSQGDSTRDHGCGKLRRNADALEHFITECIIYRLDSPELTAHLNQTHENGELRQLLSDRALQAMRLDALIDDYASGLLDRQQFAHAKATAQAVLTRLDAEIERAHREQLKLDIPAGQTVRQAWQSQPDGWRRLLMALLIKRIVVNPGITKPYYMVDNVRHRFDPSLIDIEWRI